MVFGSIGWAIIDQVLKMMGVFFRPPNLFCPTFVSTFDPPDEIELALKMTVSTELLNACRRNDRRAQYDLYRACFPVLMGICTRYKRDRDEASATVNQGFLKICTSLEKWRSEEVPFEAWVRRIMINTVIDEFRASKKEREMVQSTDPALMPTGQNNTSWNMAESNLSTETILKLIQKLSPMAQKVFNLFVMDGFSHEEIGKMLDISDGTSKWHLNAARTKLKELVTAYGIV